MICRTLLEGCSFQNGKVYQDGVSLEVTMKQDGIQAQAGGAGGEATDQTASRSSEPPSVVQVLKQASSLALLSIKGVENTSIDPSRLRRNSPVSQIDT